MKAPCSASTVLLALIAGAHAQQLLAMQDRGYVWRYPTNDGSHTIVNRPPDSDFAHPVNCM
jgi:hypothetical protein